MVWLVALRHRLSRACTQRAVLSHYDLCSVAQLARRRCPVRCGLRSDPFTNTHLTHDDPRWLRPAGVYSCLVAKVPVPPSGFGLVGALFCVYCSSSGKVTSAMV